MSKYEIGYGKPPRHSQFKAGNRANPKGRPKRAPPFKADIIDNVLSESVQFVEGGRTKTATRREATIKRLISDTFKGDMKAAAALLKLYAHAQRHGDAGVQVMEVRDWLPDYPGQTGEQKTLECEASGETSPSAWWKDPIKPPTDERS
jgi:uncharacterized protein DUF5681